jgi:RsmE family RNA methyltransferase
VNLILLEPADFVAPAQAVVRQRRFAHVRDVHRARVGVRLRVGVIGGRLGTGTVTRLDADAVALRVELDEEPPPPSNVALVLALPRPKALGRVLQCVAAMGVKRLLLAHAWRVEKSFWSSPMLRPENLRAQLLLGLEQARDTIVPEVSLHPRFKPLVEDVLPGFSRASLGLVADPRSAEPCPRAVEAPVTLAVGPEGGFIAYEIALLEAHGFRPVSLGRRILRVEHAVAALLARLG